MNTMLMFCFLRSGGTLLNRCLGCLPNTIVLSEVNPLGGGTGAAVQATTPFEQARKWYGIELKSSDFTRAILELENYCNNNGLFLIVRDWTTINFLPRTENDYNPTKVLLTWQYLQNHSSFPAFAFVRNAIDVFLSQKASLEIFARSYLDYVRAIKELDIPIFKYENFCTSPRIVLQSICNLINLTCDDNFQNFTEFTTVNGDVQLRNLSGKGERKQIALTPRKRVNKSLIRSIRNSWELCEANRLLGYTNNYYSFPMESSSEYFSRQGRHLLSKIKNLRF